MPAAARGGGTPHRSTALFVYLTCPRCGRDISQPFSRASGPIVFVHHLAKDRCRLIVDPDRQGEQHRITVVPEGVPFEQALERALLARAA